MDYYEELGIAPSASTEEIRQAYKSVARLLHPDQHQDEELRKLAECQMKRINGLVATLTNPVLRGQYDLTLRAPLIRVPHPTRAQPFWAALAIAGLCFLMWIWKHSNAHEHLPPTFPAPKTEIAVTKPTVSAHPSTRPASLREQALAERLVELELQLRALRTQPDLLPERAESPQLPAAEIMPPPPFIQPDPGETPGPAPSHEAPRGSFAGTWFYARRAADPQAKILYPPEYIEAILSEQDGLVRGRYRARYRVSDRPISPEVSFQFEGRASQDSATLRWTGEGGAEGEVQLILLSANTMRVNWSATSLGRHMGLSAGTATLIRKQ